MSPAAAEYSDQIEQLIKQADRLPDSDTRVELFHEAVRIADTRGDLSLGFELRTRMFELEAFRHRFDEYAVAFSWCLGQARKHPEQFALTSLLGTYQLVAGSLLNFPEFTRAQCDWIFSEAIRALSEHGFSLRTAYLERRSAAIDLGDRALGDEADREWRRHPVDSLNYGPDCEVGRHLAYFIFIEDYAATMSAASRRLNDPVRDIRFDPRICGYAIEAFFLAGRVAEAAALHERSFQDVRLRAGYQWYWGSHLSFLGLTGNFERAIRMFQTMLAVAYKQPDPLSKFHFLEHALVLFRQLVQSLSRKIRLRVPEGLAWRDPDGMYDAETVLRWIESEAKEIAANFDKRNGNDYHIRLLSQRREMDHLAKRYAL